MHLHLEVKPSNRCCPTPARTGGNGGGPGKSCGTKLKSERDADKTPKLDGLAGDMYTRMDVRDDSSWLITLKHVLQVQFIKIIL